MNTPTENVRPTPATLFEQATAYALDAVTQVTERDLDQTTPCAAWNVRELLLHLADIADALSNLARTGTLEVITQHRLETNAINVVRDRTHVLLDRLGPAAETNEPHDTTESEWANNAATSGAVEFTTHGWDLYAALGQPRQIPETLAQALLEITSEAIDSASRDPQFAQPVNIDPSRPPSDQLLAFLGRHPHPST